MLEGISANQGIRGLHKPGSEDRLKRTCEEFESLFLTYLLKSMRNTASKEGPFGTSNEGDIVRSMLDEYLALGIARGGGIGLGTMLLELIKE
jgi:flagellar protein FlgJ